MNVAVAVDDVRHEALPNASEAGPAPKRIVVAFGFWIFLLSDIVMFSAAPRLQRLPCDCGRPGPARSCSIKSASRSRPLVCSPELHVRDDVAAVVAASVDIYFLRCSRPCSGPLVTREVREFADMIARRHPQRSAFCPHFRLVDATDCTPPTDLAGRDDGAGRPARWFGVQYFASLRQRP
jgi:cytochrome o ubiquinol oxidase subunit 3